MLGVPVHDASGVVFDQESPFPNTVDIIIKWTFLWWNFYHFVFLNSYFYIFGIVALQIYILHIAFCRPDKGQMSVDVKIWIKKTKWQKYHHKKVHFIMISTVSCFMSGGNMEMSLGVSPFLRNQLIRKTDIKYGE